ncbi:endoplasmin-like isoform X1 [Macrobrachium nipponense]|uniref:endoplasmin-like isoform X1 n=1 Tax=Macrobrachium nipponense TaxID=159736 RepID=UPI0030C7B91F
MLQVKYRYFFVFAALLLAGCANAEDGAETVEQDIGAGMEGSRTDDNVIAREEEAIKLDGLNVAQIKEMREKAEKHVFQAEVNRMMKLIINSLYRNKEIFLRELISNASDAIDKIRLLSLTDKDELDTNSELAIRIKADKDNHILHITDSGIGMTKNELVNNLGTIAKSGTSEFFSKMQDSATSDEAGDLIGQFGVGFYSAFLVADRVVVTSKHNADKQHVWESDSAEFSVVEDPRGDTLKRGTTVSLHLKEEAYDFVEIDTVKGLIKKYSQFINFPIYLWESKTEEVEEPLDEDEAAAEEDKVEEDEEGKVEEEEEKPKTKKVSKTTWDWVLVNDAKPIWTRKPNEIEEDEYNEFYKTLSKDSKDPLAKTHFVAEGEVTFKSLLFVPEVQPSESFNKYGTRTDHIKLYVRRVFITDDFQDMMPNYLSFIRGIVDSDDLPLNVSRETLQQHKLLKVIKKKLVRKTLDMIKKMEPEEYEKFWKEYSTNIKLGAIEDSANRTRLAKLLRFMSSASKDKLTSLSEYVEKMKEKQEHIYYMAGSSRSEVENSPFVERLLKKGYEVLYLTEAIDEYSINAIPEFEGKKFQNVAKEGLVIDDSEGAKERMEQLKTTYEPLTKWLSEEALKEEIMKAEVGERLTETPCALISSKFGWTGNMQRIVTSQTHSKANDVQRDYYLSQKKTLEINPRHPLIKELLRRVEDDSSDPVAKNIATMMYHTATLRSGYLLKDTVDFAKSVEEMMRQTLGVSLSEPVEEEPEYEEQEDEDEQLLDEDEDDDGEVEEMHDEL